MEIYTITGLTAGTTYYIAIKTKDESFNESEISNVASGKTQLIQSGTKPNTVSYLTSTPQNNNSIQLNWLESTSENIMCYNIYTAAGNDDMNYAVPSYVVSRTETSITINNLTNNQEYKFVVRAVNKDGNEDINTNIISETAVTSIADTIQTKLTSLVNGVKISGKNILLVADTNISGEASSILYEYRKVGDTDWITIQPVQSNTGTSSPSYIQWDISSMEDKQQYNLRTVTTNKDGLSSINGSYITVTVDNEDPDIKEGINYKYERIDNRKLNRINILDTYTNLLSQVKISTGVLTNGTTDKLLITINPQDAPLVSKNLLQIGSIYKIEMYSGQHEFTDDLEIILPYKDTNNDNRIPSGDTFSIADAGGYNTDISVTKLIVCTFNNITGKWEKVTTTTIDRINKVLTVKTKHLSYYGIFAVIQNDLMTAHVYPNPFKPSLGHTKIYFSNLTSHTNVKIFNTTGELVYEEEKDTPTGELNWDVKNLNDKEIASGVYIYMITNNNGQTKKGKLAIIR